MKKSIAFLCPAILILLSLCACSSSTPASESMDTEAAMGEVGYDQNMSDGYTSAQEAPEAIVQSAINDSSLSEKMIYSAWANIETLEFDETLQKTDEMISSFGGFIESSSVTGVDYRSSYYGYSVTRTAEYCIRVPAANYAGMNDALSTLGNVTYRTSAADNVTTQFYDVESRLKTYRTEEERLLSMLEKAETVEDMLAIEDRLSTVRYQIESLTTSLNSWQRQVDYSTINLVIYEVFELTQEPVVQKTYWQELSGALENTMNAMAWFFKQLLIIVLCAIPVLAMPGAIALVVWRITARKRKKADNRTDKNKAPKE